MTSTRAYASQSATTPLGPHTIERREPGPHDVKIDILFCGVCHSDLHMQDGYFLLGDGKQLDVRAGRTLPFNVNLPLALMPVSNCNASGLDKSWRWRLTTDDRPPWLALT